MTAKSTANGVNVQQLVDTVNLIKENPELAAFEFRSKTKWDGGGRSVTTIESFYGAGSEHQHARTHTIEGDEPAVLLGEDTGPNAVETVLAALAACFSVGFAYNAAAQGIEINDLDIDVSGDLDLHAFLGLSDEKRPGYESLTITCKIDSPASREQLQELSSYVQRTSPVLDIVANSVPVKVELQH
jgi:uncharacterized OsmC-like protein